MSETNKNNAFLILAAGKGTRMQNNLPKVLHKICGKEMIKYAIDLAYKFSPERIGAIVSEDAPETIDFLESNYNIDLIYQNERLGTGHAVQVSLDFLEGFKGNVICLYGDTPFISEKSISDLISNLDKDDKNAVSVLGFQPKDPAKYGRLKMQDNNLAAIIEYNDATEEERNINLCNSGVIAIKSDYINDLVEAIGNNNAKGEYYLTDIIEIANSKNLKCSVAIADEQEVMGVNSQTERVEAEKIRQNFLRNKFLTQGVIMTDPDNVYLSEETEIASGVEIEPFVNFSGKVVISEGSIIRSFSYLENCTIGENNIIGPYARIRPNTNLSNDVKVGNFVEIKKSNISSGSKINHLTYIGDSEIGENVNIGAGTVTCNYDGKNKFKTTIGNNSFIGSNCSLIAPVTIGKNATIGAATTVLKNVDDNNVVINKKSQDIIK